MQNVPQGSSPPSVNIGEQLEKSSSPQSNATESGPGLNDEFGQKFISDSSESEEDDVSEVESFMIEQDVDEQDRKFLLSGACTEGVDPETQERLEALLQAAGIGRLGGADGKHLADPEVLRRLTSSVSCALDEAAAALTRMRTDHPRPEARSLVEACSDGDVSTVRKLLNEGKSVHETNEEGESLLSLACSAGYLELAQVLLAMNANVEDRGVKGDCTPLMEAASAGHRDVVTLLLNHNANVNAQSASGNTALMYACAGGHEQVVKLLLDCAANVEDHNENGHTPLMEAASAGHVGVARILLNYGAGINTHSNEFKESALTLACYKGHLDMVRFLLEAGADQEHKTDEMHTALMEASMDGHVEVARLLLDSGAQVNMPTDSFESPLTLAACGGHTELAMLLIERGANIEEVNDEGYTPLMEAAREGHEDMVALLLSQGANINAQTEETQETALTLACCGGFLEVADFLLKAGADLEAGASTPLMEAAQEGHLDLVRYLLEYHHANVNAQTQTGDTALTYACENGHTDVASLLLLYGAHLEHQSEGGRTPLMKACRAGHTYTVQYLISKSADVNMTTTNNDHTPLSLAASGGHLPVVELLLANRADPFHRLKDNSTMLIEAAKGGHTNVVHLLLDYPHSVMMASAETDSRAKPAGLAPAEELTPPVPMTQVQRSLLRKLRQPMPPLSDPVPIPPPDAKRPPPTGEASCLDCEPSSEDKTDSAAAVEPAVPYSVSHPFQVSQSTAISDRPKKKAVKGVNTLRKLMTQPAESSNDPNNLPVTTGVILTQPAHAQQLPDSIPINVAGRHVLTMQPVDGIEILQADQQQQQMWMLQHTPHAEDSSVKAIDAADQIENLVMDFAHKLEAFSLDEVTNAAEALRTRQELDVRQQLLPVDLAAAEEAYNLLSQQQQQDLTYITVPNVVDQNQRNEEGLQVQYQYTEPLDAADAATVVEMAGLSGFQLTANGQTIPINDQGPLLAISPQGLTIRPNAAGDAYEADPAELAQYEQHMMMSQHERVDMYAEGFKQGLAYYMAKDAAAGAAGTGTATGTAATVPGLTLPPRLLAAGGFPPQLLLPSAPLSNEGFSCPAPAEQPDAVPAPASSPESAPMSGPPHIQPTQVQVATQTTGDKKQPYGPPPKAKKVRFLSSNQRNPPYAHPTDPGLAQCTGAYPTPCTGAPPPTTAPLQLSSCMDVDSETDSNHDTALTLACAGGHEELVELLLSRGADIEHRDKKGFTPLILAATAGHEKVVEILLDHGADIEAQSERTKDTPLSLACSGGRYEVVELLLNKMANKEHRNVSDYTPLSLAASGGYVNIIKLLLNHGAEINSRTGSKLGISPLMLASMNGHVQAVKLLLDMGSDINAQIETNRNTALTLACFQGRHEVVSLLLDRKANVEHRAKTGLTPLMEAASGGYVEVGRVLIDKGADVNASPVPSSRDTALTIAADKGHVRFVELLLSRSALVEVKNKKGNSPLWLAANGGHLAVVELLYNLDADIDSQDNRKVSCLMAAYRKGHVKVVKWMVSHVTQFPSDQEMTRFIATISDKELLDKCHECVKIIRAAKDLQSAKANKNATILLEELDMEKNREESKKAAAARRRERKKKKKLEKKEERRKMYEENTKPESDDDDEEGDGDGDAEAEAEAAASKAERLGSASPVADKEEGDSGIDANSQGSCSSNDVKSKEPITNKRKDKKKKKGADKLSDTSPQKTLQESSKEKANERRVQEQEEKARLEAASRVQPEVQRHPAEREDFEATGNETYVPAASRGRKNTTAHQNHYEPESSTKIFTTSPKGAGKREEGWKEVVRSFPYRSKKVSVPLNAISRVIGRAGSNINAIRTATGAHIEVDKQSKGQGERTITIKGSAEAIKQAHHLIAVLIKDPEVDIMQMLPKPKIGISPAVTAIKSKALSALNKPVGSVPTIATALKPSSVTPLVAVKPSQVKTSQVAVSVQQSKVLPPRLLATVGEAKRAAAVSTKTTMSYTSVMLTPGRGSKPVTSMAPGPVPIAPLVKPRSAVGPITAPSATAPQSPQVSPQQALPSSPKHHRPLPTSSAPPSMQQLPAVKVNLTSSNNSAANHDLLTHNLLNEYSLFNNGFSKGNMWGREEEKQNFASVAATGAPAAPGAKFLDEGLNTVDVTKAPGYRGVGAPGCSPVKPFTSYPQESSTSPRGSEPTPHGLNLMAPLQMDVGASGPVGPIGPPIFGPRYTDQTPMYNSDLQYQMPSPPPPIQMSRLNPRAPDFSYPKQGRGAQVSGSNSWIYGPNSHDHLVFPSSQPSGSDLLSFDGNLINSPAMSPHSPVQPGEAKGEDNIKPRPIGPIGSGRHSTRSGVPNGYEHQHIQPQDVSWMQQGYRAPTSFRGLHQVQDLSLVDHYQNASDAHALAAQLMLAQQHQQVPLQLPPMAALDPTKMENWEIEKHAAYSEGWANAKWTH